MKNYETRLVQGPRSGAVFAACLLPAVDNGYGVARRQASTAYGILDLVPVPASNVFMMFGTGLNGGAQVELLHMSENGAVTTSSLTYGKWRGRGPFLVREGVLLEGHDMSGKSQEEWLVLAGPGKSTSSQLRWLHDPSVVIPADGASADAKVTFSMAEAAR